MRTRWMLVILLVAAATGPSSSAQPATDTGIPTETQERLRGGTGDVPWTDLIGLLGLFGLIGLKRQHADDSYRPAPLE